MSLRLSAEEKTLDVESFDGVDWLREVGATIPRGLLRLNLLSKKIGGTLAARCTATSPPIYAREESVPRPQLGRPCFRGFGRFGEIPGRGSKYSEMGPKGS